MPSREELEGLKIRNDAEAEEAMRSIKEAQEILRNTCKDKNCMNPRRPGSAWCQECADIYKSKKQ